MFDKQIQLLEQTVNQLTLLLDDETHSIVTHQLDKVVALRPRKREISDYLTTLVPAVISSHQWKEMAPEKVQQVSRMLTQAREKLEENEKALQIAEAAQEKVVSTIRDAAKTHQSPPTSYSVKGKVADSASSDFSLVLNTMI